MISLGTDAAYTASEERTTDEAVDDNKIKLELNKLLADGSLGLWQDIGTVVYRGRVLLIGAVETPEAKAKAGEIGHMPEGVKEVINDIQVTEEGGVGSFVNDVAIEKSIQTEYLCDSDIDSANFRVRSVNGTVYLIGLAESRAELDQAHEIAKATGDVKTWSTTSASRRQSLEAAVGRDASGGRRRRWVTHEFAGRGLRPIARGWVPVLDPLCDEFVDHAFAEDPVAKRRSAMQLLVRVGLAEIGQPFRTMGDAFSAAGLNIGRFSAVVHICYFSTDGPLLAVEPAELRDLAAFRGLDLVRKGLDLDAGITVKRQFGGPAEAIAVECKHHGIQLGWPAFGTAQVAFVLEPHVMAHGPRGFAGPAGLVVAKSCVPFTAESRRGDYDPIELARVVTLDEQGGPSTGGLAGQEDVLAQIAVFHVFFDQLGNQLGPLAHA